MSESPPPPVCAACGVPLVAAHMGGGRMMFAPVGVSRRVAAEPHVCPKCGRVDWVVVDVAPFRDRAAGR